LHTAAARGEHLSSETAPQVTSAEILARATILAGTHSEAQNGIFDITQRRLLSLASSLMNAREYNEERPKKSLSGLTPAQYAKQLAAKAVTIPENSNALGY
jgi:transposase InsO family protein